MGDAPSSSDVRPARDLKASDDLDTIDGVVHPSASSATPRGGPPTDYVEPVSVEQRHYALGDEIGKGGMGRVRKARDLRLGRDVAVKTLRNRHVMEEARFAREARITAKLQHPAIIQVYEAGRLDGSEPFYAMPFVDGRRLNEAIKELASLDQRLALVSHVIAVADAVAYAHSKHVIHRDLKPSNVLVGAFGETVVIDWGLAKDLGAPFDPQVSMQLRRVDLDETGVGRIVGTAAYMPPEQARGEAVDQRADVYSIGAILYHVLTGSPPYTGASDSDSLLEKVKRGELVALAEVEPNTPRDLVAIVERAMARLPGDRYPDAEALAQDLKRFQAKQLVEAYSYTMRERFTRWVGRHRLAIGIGASAVISLAVVGMVSVSRILHEQELQHLRRNTLLEERGRTEQLAGNSGRALVNLVEAARDNRIDGARALLMADAIRPFEAQLMEFPSSGTPDSVAFSPAGLVITLDKRVEHRWPFGMLDRAYGEPPDGARLLVARDGRVLVVAGKAIEVYSRDGALIRTLDGHDAEILDAHLGDDDRTLVTGSADGTARAWDLVDFTYQTADCKGAPVIAVRLSPDSERVVSAFENHEMCYWKSVDGGVIKPLRGHRGRISTIRWSPERGARRYVVTASSDGQALVWDPEGGKPAFPAIVHDGRPIVSAEWASDGRAVLTAGTDQLARLWELPVEPTAPAQELRRFAGHSAALTAAIFDTTDERIVTAGNDRKARLWAAMTGELLATFEHADVIHTIALSPDGKRLLTASLDRTARLWDLTSGVARPPLEVDAAIHDLAVGPAGQIATAGEDSRVRTWASPEATPVIHREHAARVHAVAFSSTGLLASGGEEVDVIVRDTVHGLRRSYGPHTGRIRALAFSRGRLVAAAGDQVRLWWLDGTIERTLVHDTPIARIAIPPDGFHVAAVDERGRVVIWGAGDPVVYPALTNGPTRAIAFSDDGSRLVASGTDTKVYAFDGTPRSLLVTVDGPTGEVAAVAFTRDRSCVITAGVDGLIQIWDADRGKLMATRGARGAEIHAIALSPDGATLWGAGADQLVRSWDLRTEVRSVDALQSIVRRVPWRLDEIDVVRKIERSP